MHSLKSKAVSALRSSEKLLKLDMVYLIKGGFWTTLSFISGTLASLVTMVAFGNLLPREAYGTYNYLLSLGASLSFLTLSGIGTAVMRAVARGNERIIPVAFKLQLKFNLLAIAAILAAAFYYGFKGNMLFAVSLTIIAIAYPISESFHLYKQIFTGRKRFDLLTKISSATTLTSALITVIALLLTDSVLVLIAIYALTTLIPNVLAYRMAVREIDRTPPEPEEINEMKRTAFHLTGAGVIGVIASYIDKIILFQAAGPAALAVYGFATAGPERLKSLIKNWTSIALPRLARQSLSNIRVVILKRIGFSMLIGLMLFVIYFAVAPFLFRLFLPRYLDAIIYSQALAVSLIFSPAVIYIGSVFSSQNMLRAVYLLNFTNHVARIALFVILGFIWKIWGLVFAAVSSSALNMITSLIIWEIEARRLINKQES